jgi:hypothetical protein
MISCDILDSFQAKKASDQFFLIKMNLAPLRELNGARFIQDSLLRRFIFNTAVRIL